MQVMRDGRHRLQQKHKNFWCVPHWKILTSLRLNKSSGQICSDAVKIEKNALKRHPAKGRVFHARGRDRQFDFSSH